LSELILHSPDRVPEVDGVRRNGRRTVGIHIDHLHRAYYVDSSCGVRTGQSILERQEDHAVSYSELSHAQWNPHVHTIGDDELDRRCAALVASCEEFVGRYKGSFYSRDTADIAAALHELGRLYGMAAELDGLTAAGTAVSADDPAPRDRRSRVVAAMDDMDGLVQFVELEWLLLPDEVRQTLLADRRLGRHRHYLSVVSDAAGYTLTPDAETALATRDYPAEAAWVELYQQITRDLRPTVGGRSQSMEQARRWLEKDDAQARVDALASIYDALEPVASTLAACLDTLVADRLSVDDLRGLPHPRAERDLTNELPGAIVDDMLDLVTREYATAQRWFHHKARLLGAERLRFEDMRAPLGPVPYVPYHVAVATALETFDRFAHGTGQMVREMFAHGRVDALPRNGKDAGAFCRSMGPNALPCVFMSYFGTVEDVICLVHELGHAVHFASAASHNDGLTLDPPLAMTEIAPALAELLAYDLLIEQQDGVEQRRLVAAKRIEGIIETVFLSAFLTRFETCAHVLRADGLVLSDRRLRDLWTACSREFYGPDVILPDRWGLHWMLVPHLVHARFYSYTYVFARLVALRLYAAHRDDPAGVSRAVLDMLRHGGSVDLSTQLHGVGVDIADPATWQASLAELGSMVNTVTL
jgi:oligoendopeptidase F